MKIYSINCINTNIRRNYEANYNYNSKTVKFRGSLEGRIAKGAAIGALPFLYAISTSTPSSFLTLITAPILMTLGGIGGVIYHFLKNDNNEEE